MTISSHDRTRAAMAILAAALLGGCGGDSTPALPAGLACQVGAWTFDSGETMVLAPANGELRYRFLDGRIGLLQAKDSGQGQYAAREGWRQEGPLVASATFGPCPAERLEFELLDGPAGTATRVELPTEDTTFASGDLTLRGRLVLPAQTDGPVPLAVLVHGSEDYSGVDIYPKQYLLPAQGVAVFVYDKRGTGGSQGEYTQDFHVLADDAVAALETARRLRPGGFSRTGFIGSSQGGWIAPLAASQADVDYVVAEFGLAETALAEDREQVMDDLRAGGHGDDVRDQARAIFARLDVQTSWEYEPMPVLESLPMPQLWIIAGEDLEAPNTETLRRIRQLQSQGLPVDLAVFPDTDHGFYEFAEENGDRTMLRHPDGYLRLLAEWAAGSGLDGDYGSAQLEPAKNRRPSLPGMTPDG